MHHAPPAEIVAALDYLPPAQQGKRERLTNAAVAAGGNLQAMPADDRQVVDGCKRARGMVQRFGDGGECWLSGLAFAGCWMGLPNWLAQPN